MKSEEHEREVREHQRVSGLVESALTDVADLKPRWCQVCDQFWGEDECDHTIVDTVVAPSAYMVEFAVISHWMAPDGTRGTLLHFTPHAPRHHITGLIEETLG